EVHVRRRVEGRGAREQAWVVGDEEERLLAAHALADGVDPAALEAKPRERASRERRHAGEVGDLARIAPREEDEPAPLSLRADQREAASRGEVPPEQDVLRGPDAAPVRRAGERDRRV